MSSEVNIVEDDVSAWPIEQLALEDVADTADTTLHDHLQIYGAELKCTGWSLEEKMTFLGDDANRAFLREFSAANRKRIQDALWTDLAFD